MVTVIVLLVLLVLRKRIALVVTLFQEAGRAVHAMPVLILTPLLVSNTVCLSHNMTLYQTFVTLAVITALWLYGSLWIFSAGDPAVDEKTGFVKYEPDTFLLWMRW